MHILLTGGSGFIGSHLVRFLLERAEVERVVNIDALTYAASEATLQDLSENPLYQKRYHFYHADITDQAAMEPLFAAEAKLASQQGKKIDAIINIAAESHVDRSITFPHAFVQTNVLGTNILLELARRHHIGRFLQISTDEVYGALGLESKKLFTEETPLSPRSPYSASKASADLLVQAAHHTYGQNVVITRCSNNYGPYQFPEKLIPLMILSAMKDQPLPLYGDGLYIRDWIHVEDHVAAVWEVLLQGRSGEAYNIGTHTEISNKEVVERILAYLKKPTSLITHVADRLGHDRRYAINSAKITQELGWKPKYHFTEALPETIEWYLHHSSWWEPLLERRQHFS